MSSASEPAPASGTPAQLRFLGGTAGALAPLALFLAGVSWLGLSGAPDETGFWPILLIALTLGLLLARDKEAYGDAVVEGMSRPIVMTMVLAWLLAGVLGTLLRESGMVEALIWGARRFGVEGGGYVAVTFLVAAFFSTATGTSLGTLLVCLPLLYPVGPELGAKPTFVLGAILGGATFGDNVSPISDTTIASAGTQGADLAGVVRSRLRYALPAAGLALAVALLGGGSPTPVLPPPQSASAQVSLSGVSMLAAPVVVLALLLRRRGLFASLAYGVLAATGLGLASGTFQPSDLIAIDANAFSARGLLLDGMRRAVGISIFTVLLMGLVGGVESAGLLDRLVAQARERARGPRSAEAWIFASVSGAVLLTTHSVVAILAVGRLTREAGSSFGLGPYRRANLLDVTVCTYPFLLPFFIPTILASALTAGLDPAPRLSPLQAGLYNAHSWALLTVIVLAIITGWGRDDEAHL
jgi:Na+/H+ antiporter NhaC